MKRYILLAFLSIGLIFTVNAQDEKGRKLTKEEREQYSRAEYLFAEGNYIAALPIYLKLDDALGGNAYMKYKAGISYLYKTDEKEKAITYLEEAFRLDSFLLDIHYYLGRAYHLNYRQEEALDHLNQFLNTGPDVEMVTEAEMIINWVKNAQKAEGKQIEAEIINVGSEINSKWSEYVPVISADESVLIFTYRGVRSKGGLQDIDNKPDPDGIYYEDIFISYKLGDKWITPESIGDNINTSGHDAAIALSADGQKLFVYKSTPKDGGDIYISYLKGDIWSAPERLGPNINTKSWEGSCSLSSDEQTLYFSSERPGGYGGRDIYRSRKKSDGTWGPAENLGPEINTPYDDDAPFIHPDGISLFFSSQGHNSVGGFDIFHSNLLNEEWTTPENLGYPINTAGDDIYYVLNADGKKGYYSSSRADGYGMQDIYLIEPGISGTRPVLALVIGNVTAEGQPVEAEITVTDETNGVEVGKFNSNAKTGKYLLALSPGNKYKVAFEVEGYEQHIEYIDVQSLDAYIQVEKDFHFGTDENNQKKLTISDAGMTLQQQIHAEILKYKEESADEYLEQSAYNEVLKVHGSERNEGVEFFVDLGKFDQNSDLPERLEKIYPLDKALSFDGRTRATAGPFKTVLEAEIYRQKFLAVDTSLANISVKVIDNGQVKTLKQYYPEIYENVAETQLTDNTYPGIGTQDQAKSPLDDPSVKKIPGFETRVIEGLSFKVELGSVMNPADFRLSHLEKYGKITAKKYDDGTTKYTMGPFETLKEAEDFKQMLINAEPDAEDAFVTVFYFGQRKTLEEFNTPPCDEQMVFQFSKDFIGKDLNDTSVYNDMLRKLGTFNCDDFTFKVQIGAYRQPVNFKYDNLSEYGPAEVMEYPDGITRFTMKEFPNLMMAEDFRQQVIRRGVTDAWITAVYKGERKLLEDLFRNNFYMMPGGM